MLSVSFDESVISATRITSLYSFASVITGIIGGIFIRYIRRIKWVAVTGTLIFISALGMMIKFRSASDNGHAGVIGAQIRKLLSGYKRMKHTSIHLRFQFIIPF